MLHNKYLLLDSRDRLVTSPSTSDCTFQLTPALNSCKQVDLVSFAMPNTQYNVNSTNNKIYFNDGANKECFLTIGNTDLSTLLTEIKTAMEGVSGLIFTVTYTLQEKIQITATGNFFMRFSVLANSASAILGFNNVNTTLSPFQLAPNVVNLSLPLYVYIIVDEFSSTTKSTNNFDNASFTVFNNVNGGDVLTFTENSFYPQTASITDTNIQTIHIQLQTYNNTIIDLNGSNWAMLLRIQY